MARPQRLPAWLSLPEWPFSRVCAESLRVRRPGGLVATWRSVAVRGCEYRSRNSGQREFDNAIGSRPRGLPATTPPDPGGGGSPRLSRRISSQPVADSSLDLPDSSQARPIRPCPCPIRHILELRSLTVSLGVIQRPRSFLPLTAPAGVRS
jgi:hypothetical protein